MKTNIFFTSLFICTASVVVTSCNFSTEQKAETLEKAKANVVEASHDLDLARADSAEFVYYKLESEKKLKENELLIADMKDRMKSERKVSMVKYNKQLDSLDMQNSHLRNDMHFYSSQGKENWEKFKKRFNTELDALGKAISQLAEKNMKKAS
jgi:hypothetical protein